MIETSPLVRNAIDVGGEVDASAVSRY